MGEAAKIYDTAHCDTAGEPQPATEEIPRFNLRGGVYFDPDIGAVNYYNAQSLDPDLEFETDQERVNFNVETNIMAALVWTGVVPSRKQMMKPLEQIGVVPAITKDGDAMYEDEIRYPTESGERRNPSVFEKRRGDDLIEEFDAEDQALTLLVQRIRRAIQMRKAYTQEQVDELYMFSREKITNRGQSIPPALRMVSVMVGGKPDDEYRDRIKPVYPETAELAPEVVMMLIREDMEKETSTA